MCSTPFPPSCAGTASLPSWSSTEAPTTLRESSPAPVTSRVSHPLNRGQGDALCTGFALALERGASIVVTMDADGQHRPEELPRLIAPILSGEADYVQGSRYLGTYDDSGGARDLGIRAFTRLINTTSGAGDHRLHEWLPGDPRRVRSRVSSSRNPASPRPS